MTELVIQDETGRLDKVIAKLMPEISRSKVQRWIESGDILVNGKTEKTKYAVQPGDKINLVEPEPVELDLIPQDIPLDIVYEDDDVIVVNKPQGMVVHPSPGHADGTLVNALLFHSPLSTINGAFRPGIVHRIDKDTSGLLMVAKNDKAHQSLAAQLKAKTNIREYIALVHQPIKEESGIIKAPLGRSPKDRMKQAVVKDGRPAVTHFKVEKNYENYSLIKCQLETGRTHQIRVHMQYIGHPVVGDPLYGSRKTIKGHGQFLHAAKLGFKHPTTGKELIFEVPIPPIFKSTLDYLDKTNAIR
ncbi:RluA family pseudouridine synthase [Dellaglioa sp. P0083]|uniref:RluA family pseudouridine synthase n=1 Tax=Dellaglioa kimchii TaxID=3344667 RepID=UPI0038D4ACEC